jgi:cytochrome c-type protein NrfB
MGVRMMVAVLVVMGLAVGAAAVENKGPEQIVLDGGSRGNVSFPHYRHQNALGDCQVCHALFPQEIGGIARLKSEGQLVKKQVMNKLCIKCHKAQQKMGKPAGPRTCTKCHVKTK